MKKKKLYFESENSNVCCSLEYHLHDAIVEGKSTVELFEAIPDTVNKNLIWCTEYSHKFERSGCNKNCPQYFCTSGRICDFRYKLYTHGAKVKVVVPY